MRTFVLEFVLVLLAVISFSFQVMAQPDKLDKKDQMVSRAINIFPESLKSDVPGIVESTIYNVIVCKKYYPDKDYTEILDDLNSLANGTGNPSLRYKAYLASMYLRENSRIDVKPVSSFDHEYIFKQIADQLERQLLASEY